MTTKPSKTLVVIAGPTAVGKTDMAIRIAHRLQTGIISADARQFFREIKIGTAAPTAKELEKVRHYFVGHLSVGDYYNVAMFEQQALKVLDELFGRSDYAVLTGGSGLYIDALCHGFNTLPGLEASVRERVRKTYQKEGLAGLRKWLRNVDPEYYRRVDLANPNRIMRGLEVFLQTGKPYSAHLMHHLPPRPFIIKKVVLNLDRKELFLRINSRVDRMIAEGLVEEALNCYAYRYTNAMNTVGFKEIYSWIYNDWSLKTAIEKIKTNSRRYARRQLVWFRRYEDAAWFHPGEWEAIIQWVQMKDETPL